MDEKVDIYSEQKLYELACKAWEAATSTARMSPDTIKDVSLMQKAVEESWREFVTQCIEIYKLGGVTMLDLAEEHGNDDVKRAAGQV